VKSRFHLTAPFRLVRQRCQKKTYANIDEQIGLLASRRDSADSNQTLVEEQDVDPASQMLTVLAPLVSGLQKLRLRIPAQTDEVMKQYEEVCGNLKVLIVELEGSKGTEGDEHDLEMRSLMLSALLKKVQAERQAITTASQVQAKHKANSTTTLTTTSPSAPKFNNPFVLHATSVNLTRKYLAPTQRVSVSKTIPSIVGAAGPPPPYSSFVGGAQSSTWAMNIIRLGSFQNSMLFSPSPIAVRKIVTGKAKA